MAESIFSRDGMTRGGLDRYLAPPAGDYSNLPEAIEDPKHVEDVKAVDCAGADKDEAVCQIAEAEKSIESKANA